MLQLTLFDEKNTCESQPQIRYIEINDDEYAPNKSKLPRIFVYDNLNIHQKINLHSNCCYAPHFTRKYSFRIGTQDVNKWMTERPWHHGSTSYIPTIERNYPTSKKL